MFSDLNKPNFFIVGAAKAGTTSLYHYLNQHPDIFMCPIKEPNYFCEDITKQKLNDPSVPMRGFDVKKYVSGSMEKYYHNAFVTNWDDYLALFKNVTNECAVGDASVHYLMSNVASKNIKTEIPNAKIIMILRNPVNQVISNYLARLTLGRTNKSFHHEILHSVKITSNNPNNPNSLLAQGLYFNRASRFFNEFPQENIKVVIYDNYKNNPEKTINEILIFLNVKSAIDLNLKEAHNVSRGIKFQKIIYLITFFRIKHKLWKIIPNSLQLKIKNSLYKPVNFQLNLDDKNYLINYFKNDIEKTADLIGINLNNWITQ